MRLYFIHFIFCSPSHKSEFICCCSRLQLWNIKQLSPYYLLQLTWHIGYILLSIKVKLNANSIFLKGSKEHKCHCAPTGRTARLMLHRCMYGKHLFAAVCLHSHKLLLLSLAIRTLSQFNKFSRYSFFEAAKHYKNKSRLSFSWHLSGGLKFQIQLTRRCKWSANKESRYFMFFDDKEKF